MVCCIDGVGRMRGCGVWVYYVSVVVDVFSIWEIFFVVVDIYVVWVWLWVGLYMGYLEGVVDEWVRVGVILGSLVVFIVVGLC